MTLFTLFSVQIYAQEWKEVSVPGRITHVQPMTGLVLWKDQARQLNSKYGQTIQLEFAYLLPNKVVKGCKQDGTILYDWAPFELYSMILPLESTKLLSELGMKTLIMMRLMPL